MPTEILGRRDFLTVLGAAASARALGQETRKPDFTLRIGPVNLEVQPGKVVKTMGYNGAAPGPLLRFREGQTVTIEVINGSSFPELVHWHGLRVPSDVDGSMEEKVHLSTLVSGSRLP